MKNCIIHKKIVILLLTLLSTFAVQAGDSVNNGGGLSEQNFWFAYSIVPQIYQSCIDSSDCRLGKPEKVLIEKVLLSFTKERATKDQLQFLENQSKTFFSKDGVIFVAITEPFVGSAIWINRDLIYFKSSDNSVIAYSVGQAISTITEQFLVHQNVKNAELRNYISQMVKKFYETN